MALDIEKFKYVYNIPYLERRNLCKILNRNNKWQELAGMYYFKFHFKNLEFINQN